MLNKSVYFEKNTQLALQKDDRNNTKGSTDHRFQCEHNCSATHLLLGNELFKLFVKSSYSFCFVQHKRNNSAFKCKISADDGLHHICPHCIEESPADSTFILTMKKAAHR